VVVSTRDCSLQRRNQKLVEEAPAPYLTDEQNERLYEASRAILREAGYQGAGTCEFLVGTDGTISFLEVNTRLQVEHPVSEEISGLDLVREQFRIARGEKIEEKDPVLRGHSFEFRINGEDAGRSFMPAPGTIEKMTVPTGPGVRWDSGFVAGDVIGGNFDSMLAKLIVTGADRKQALQRARRALAELSIEGMPTVIPFHRVVLDDPAFAPAEGGEFKVHTRWTTPSPCTPVLPVAWIRMRMSAPPWSLRSTASVWRCPCLIWVAAPSLPLSPPPRPASPVRHAARRRVAATS